MADRARLAVLDPQRNSAREALDRTGGPILGLFNDIPRHHFRESDARASGSCAERSAWPVDASVMRHQFFSRFEKMEC